MAWVAYPVGWELNSSEECFKVQRSARGLFLNQIEDSFDTHFWKVVGHGGRGQCDIALKFDGLLGSSVD